MYFKYVCFVVKVFYLESERINYKVIKLIFMNKLYKFLQILSYC